jgi:two-component system, NtrC family, sensor histidine kinase HydH
MIPRLEIAAGVALLAIAFAAWAIAGYQRRRRRRARRLRDDERLLTLMNGMSATMAHQVRNPLSSLKGHAQLLSRHLPAPELQDQAERIVHESLRVEKAVADLVRLWSLKRWSPRQIDPARFVGEWAGSVPDARIRTDTSRAPASWAMDPDRVINALESLLVAIRRDVPPPAPIDLVLLEYGGSLVLLMGTLEAAGSAAPTKARERDSAHGSPFAIAQLVARQHEGWFSTGRGIDGAPLFCLVLGRL